MTLQAIVFDFDGVIADTEPVHLLAFQEELAKVGVPLGRQAYLDKYLGYSDREGFPAVARDAGRVLSTADVERMMAQKTVRVQELLREQSLVFPGVVERVAAWSGRLPIAIASGALRAEVLAVTDAAGLTPCFRTIVSADDPVPSKPAPDPYLLAMRQLEALDGASGPLDPSRCVAIEDSRWGIVAAKAAGMRVIGVTTSYAADALSEAHLVVSGVGDLTIEDLDRLTSSVD